MVKIAVCYWGIPRSIRGVIASHREKVFDELDKHGIQYDVYAHFWKTEQNRVWESVMDVPLDYDAVELLGARRVQIDPQAEFWDTIHFPDYYYEHERDNEWNPLLLRNHLCALESQKRCVNLCVAANVTYDYVMFLRPDALVETTFPVAEVFWQASIHGNEIILPTNNHYEGLNDRFAVVRFEHVLWYSHRVNRIKEFRAKYGRIVSEKYVKHVVDEHYVPRFVEFNFRLLRSDGSIA